MHRGKMFSAGETELKRVLLILACLTLAACSKPKGSEYFPSPRVGSRSEFAVELGGLLGVQHATMVSRVDEETTIQGKNYFKSISTFSGIPGVDQQTSYSRVAPEGVYILDGDDLAKPEYLDTPFPVGVGNSWKSIGPTSQSNYSVIGVETVDTPTRTFKNCLRLTFKRHDKSGLTEGTQYLAPGIGLVRMVATASGVPVTFTLVKNK
jgi:hypothetical protein